MRIRYLTAACALTIVILDLLTLAFSTNAKRALYVMQSPLVGQRCIIVKRRSSVRFLRSL